MFEMSMGIMKGESRSGPAFEQDLALLGDGLQAADAGADEHADFVAVDPVKVQARIAQGLPGGMDAELGEAVGAPDFLGGRKGGSWVEILDLGGDLAVELGGVEAGDPGRCRTGRRAGSARRRRPGDPKG